VFWGYTYPLPHPVKTPPNVNGGGVKLGFYPFLPGVGGITLDTAFPVFADTAFAHLPVAFCAVLNLIAGVATDTASGLVEVWTFLWVMH
jgi:hypothetical protein